MRREPARAAAADCAVPRHQGAGELVAALRRHIARIEQRRPRFDRRPCRAEPWLTGLAPIDAHLPLGGLSPLALHDIAPAAYGDAPAAMGWTLALSLRRLAADGRDRRPLLWCRLGREAREYGRLYGFGLEALGLPRARFITVTLKRPLDVLRTAEEALRSGALAIVVADADARHADLTRTRRLALAAAAGKTTALLVFASSPPVASASHSRWRVASTASRASPDDDRAPGLPTWTIQLTRARGGRPGEWQVEWTHAAHRFGLVSGIPGGALHPRAGEAGPGAAGGRGRTLRAG